MRCPHRRHLHVHIFLTLVATVLMATCLMGAASWWWRQPPDLPAVAGVADLIVRDLPPPTDPGFPAALAALGGQIRADITLREADGRLIGATGPEIGPGPPGWWFARDRRGLRAALSDGRMLALGAPNDHRPPAFLLGLAAVALVFAAGTWPVSRSITRRLEVVRDGMQRWGEGALDVRVPVHGHDEVADVARAFNAAAARVEALVQGQRRTLASASHELRSPLGRIRMALELLDDGSPERGAWVAEAARDVEEIDATVGDLLQVGRMQAVGLSVRVDVDLTAIAAEEALRAGASVDGPAVHVHGDPRLLRRLVRNLLENAGRHGRPPIVVRTAPGGLSVEDAGTGVPPDQVDRIFEPFWRPPDHAEGRDGGVGLGLWLVQEIARAHGGACRYEAREGGGSRFVVSLAGATR